MTHSICEYHNNELREVDHLSTNGKPNVVCFGGVDLSTNKYGELIIEVVKNILGAEKDASINANIYSVQYANDPNCENASTRWQELIDHNADRADNKISYSDDAWNFVSENILPLISKDGKFDANSKHFEGNKIDPELAKKRLQSLTMVGYCYGCKVISEIGEITDLALKQVGYSEEERKNIASAVKVLSLAPAHTIDTTDNHFTTLHVMNSQDRSRDNFGSPSATKYEAKEPMELLKLSQKDNQYALSVDGTSHLKVASTNFANALVKELEDANQHHFRLYTMPYGFADDNLDHHMASGKVSIFLPSLVTTYLRNAVLGSLRDNAQIHSEEKSKVRQLLAIHNDDNYQRVMHVGTSDHSSSLEMVSKGIGYEERLDQLFANAREPEAQVPTIPTR